MINWKQMLLNCLKVLLIVVMVSLSSACGSNNKSNDENSLVACDTANSDSCEVSDEELSSQNFLGSQIFETMFNAVNEYYEKMQNLFSSGAKTFMMVAFAIWLALRLLKYVSSVTENNISEVWNEILRKMFVCVLCTLIVTSTTALNAFVNTFIMPIYMAFLDLGVNILQGTQAADSNGMLKVFGEEVSVGSAKFSCSAFSGGIELSAQGLPDSFKEIILCMLNYLGENLTIGGKAGLKAMAMSKSALGSVIGFCLFLCFLIVKVCFVFYLVDSMFQLAIILFMLPIFVMAYAFGPTKGWATKAFSYVLSTSAFLMCFSVIVALTVRAMIDLIRNNEAVFNSGDNADLSVAFICLMLIGFLITGASGVASQLTSSWVGGSITSNFQQKLKGLVQGAAQAAWKGVTALATFGAAAFPNTVIGRGIETIKNIDKRLKYIQKKAGR